MIYQNLIVSVILGMMVQLDFDIKLSAEEDLHLADDVLGMVNTAYAISEGDMWTEGHQRMNLPRLKEMISQQELIIAKLGEEVVGCLHIENLGKPNVGFKMLVVKNSHRGKGLGQHIMDYVHKLAEAAEAESIELELLFPVEMFHRDKEMLKAWYGRMGYRIKKIVGIDDLHPGGSKKLLVPSRVMIMEKKV